MADKKISQLTALSAANLAPSTDVLAIVDTSATETKKVTAKDLVDGALNGGTANGVLYLNASKVATSGSALVFDGTSLGLGVTPSAWVDYKALQLPGSSFAGFSSSGNNQAVIVANAAFTGSPGSWKYVNTDEASQYRQIDGQHQFFTAASGTAGNAISFTQAMTLDANGTLTVKGTGSGNGNLIFDDPGTAIVSAQGTAGSELILNGRSLIKFTTGGTPTGTERGRFTAGGDFEIGTQAGTGTRTLTIQTNTSGDPTLVLSAAGADSGQFWFERSTVRLYARSSNTGGVYLASGGTSWTAVSDERKKDIIEPISNAAEKVASLRAVVGKYKTDQDGVRRSFLIAQDVQAVFPEAIDASDENELGLSYTDTIPLLVAAIKELKVELDAAKVKIAALEAK